MQCAKQRRVAGKARLKLASLSPFIAEVGLKSCSLRLKQAYFELDALRNELDSRWNVRPAQGKACPESWLGWGLFFPVSGQSGKNSRNFSLEFFPTP